VQTRQGYAVKLVRTYVYSSGDFRDQTLEIGSARAEASFVINSSRGRGLLHVPLPLLYKSGKFRDQTLAEV
jgi:hypothetical protein